MAAAKRPRAQSAGPVLPPITVGKFEAIGEAVEQMVAENTSLFIQKGQAYRERHREGTSRPLTPGEAAELASVALDERSVEERAAAFQSSELRAHDAPTPMEVLAAAGASTAPAFLRAARRVVALVEMSIDAFDEAWQQDRIHAVTEEHAQLLLKLELPVARIRARAALEHFAAQAGDETGKGLSLLVQSLWRSFEQAVQQLVPSPTSPSGSSSLSASPTSSTGPSATSGVSPGGAP